MPSDFIETLRRRSDEKLEKQKDVGVQKMLEAMAKISLTWEKVEEITTTTDTPPTTTVRSDEDSTPQSTTLGASSLSVHISLLLIVFIIISLMK